VHNALGPAPFGAISDTDDPASDSPLNIFGDQDPADDQVTPWIRLLSGPADAPVGTTFRVRVNLVENQALDFDDLDYVLMYFEYTFS